MNVALVHDQLSEFGGAERVLLALSEMYPDAPIYTAYYKKRSPAWERFKEKDIRVSWAHSIPGFAAKLHSPLRFLAPAIWNSLDFSEYDVVISSSSWYITKGFIKKGKAIEICYCHTPPRWLYGYQTSVNWQKYPLVRWYGFIVGFFMRQYDFRAAQRVDCFIANSKETQRRIAKFYRRDSVVIYPPVELTQKSEIRNPKSEHKDYYLVVSRLAAAKNAEVAIRAANSMGFRLKIAGTGPDERRLRSVAGKTVEFLGHVSDERLPQLYAGAKAFLALATDEDFGMTPVEAMSVGTPVIAYRGGGYVESVIDGKTGILFDSHTVDGLIRAIVQFERKKNNWSDACISQAKTLSKERFVHEMRKIIVKNTQR